MAAGPTPDERLRRGPAGSAGAGRTGARRADHAADSLGTGSQPTLLCPPDAQALELLQRLGPAVELADEDQFEVATVSAAIYGWAQALIAAGADWSAANGLDPDTARQLVARTFVAAGRMVSEKDAPVQRLLEELVTPGGITEAGLRHLEGKAVPQAWSQACDIVLARLRGNS